MVKKIITLSLFLILFTYGLYNIFSCRLFNAVYSEVNGYSTEYNEIKKVAYLTVKKKYPFSIAAGRANSKLKYVSYFARNNNKKYISKNINFKSKTKKPSNPTNTYSVNSKPTKKYSLENSNKSDIGLWGWTADRKIKYSDIKNLSKTDLRIMRNEIYARHGWVFKSKDLQNYFAKTAWYKPAGSYANRNWVNKQVLRKISELEKQNAAFIKKYE